MHKLIICVLFTFSIISLSFAQNIKVQPYLQDATPNSIFILWETDMPDESKLEWGTTEALGNSVVGSSQNSAGDAWIHEVKLENLEASTHYFYKVISGAVESSVTSFKTPPNNSDHESFRIVAMSDVQLDGAHPNKFQEIVQQGVIKYLEEEFGGSLIDNLALVMIPGDLVVDGNNYSSWSEHFFKPGQDLFRQVPVYPVLGNHENNSTYYFQYFKLPENGSVGYKEHWWHKDYGNVRIIGLNSNAPYSNQEQLDWLQIVLDSTCANDSIDFVFAQLHHPHKSELWTPGESGYTGDVINQLENFSTDCGKPSIHFFGHTHAYSRGQSRDHKHLWINVATAGGAIDNWGEFPNFDYDEFSVSQDDYGFVLVEVSDDDNPKITVKRISRGDQDEILDNVLTDSVTMHLHPTIVNKPETLFPVQEFVIPDCVILKANDFSSPNSLALHGQSHWQLSTSPNDFTLPATESWKNYENWYFEEDTQQGDDLTDEKILGLDENTTYWWRVRYRDREFNWSEWSDPAAFTTTISSMGPNLLENGGAEDNLDNWTIIEGVVESLTDTICFGTWAHSGDRYFAVGGLCEHSEVGRCIQDISVDSYVDSIDLNKFQVTFGGFFSDYNSDDIPEMRLLFLDEIGNELATSITVSTLSTVWTQVSASQIIPPLTRIIRVELKGTRYAGTDNDSYIDDLFLRVGYDKNDCSEEETSIVNEPFQSILNLNAFPNPLSSKAFIPLPERKSEDLSLFVTDAMGTKIKIAYEYEFDHLVIESSNLPKGSYFFLVKEKGILIGSGKLIVL